MGEICRLAPKLLMNRIRYGRYLDVLVAHSPPWGIHDQPIGPHQGFKSFLWFMRWFKPRYLLHGHIHLYRRNVVTESPFVATNVINVYPYKLMNLEPWRAAHDRRHHRSGEPQGADASQERKERPAWRVVCQGHALEQALLEARKSWKVRAVADPL